MGFNDKEKKMVNILSEKIIDASKETIIENMKNIRIWLVAGSGGIDALQTETQVMVKREDEQAFAELNGSNLKFVEDAARLIHERLSQNDKVIDFKIICSHLESLHSHDAISVLIKGVNGGLTSEVPVEVYRSLVC